MAESPAGCATCGAPVRSGSAVKICASCLLKTGMAEDGEPLAERLFRAALAFDETERGHFLTEAAAGDSQLLLEVGLLFQGYAEAGGDDALPTLGEAVSARSEWAVAEQEIPGTVIGNYRLAERIGEGGMGTVWRAEQTAPVQREVALKVIKLGMDTREVVQRFKRERQTLALMEHPHIARVFDAGATPAGRPYFVMELVRGKPVTEYCRERALPAPERLRLFMSVCAAVQHAHQKGIIHRDLKPSNILVADGVPTVIDFGVARFVRADGGEALLTRHTQMLGTPVYMSPEQALGGGAGVDTRTDVYSLGVILYELLTGTTPFEAARFHTAAAGEIQRILKDELPPKPSTRVSTAGRKTACLTKTAASVRELKGDLDWIVMKAMEKDPARRYASAAAMADDVQRHLNHEPVSAAAPGFGYLFSRFARRHRAAVVGIAAVVLALAAGLIVSLVQVQRANEALTGQTLARKEATFTLSDMYARFGLEAHEKGEPSRAALWFTKAAIIAEADPARAEANRLRAATWTADASVPVRAFETGLPHIEHMAWHPRGRALILTKINGGSAQVWDLESEAPAAPAAAGADSAAWDTGGTRLCLCSGGKLRVLEYPSGKLLAEREGMAPAVAFHPDSGWIAVAAQSPFLWDWKSGATKPAATVSGGCKRVRWSPDGRFVLWQTMDRVGICAAEHPDILLFEPVKNLDRCLVDFIGVTGRFFHSPGGENRSFIREAETGRVISEIAGGEYALAASPDGKLLARAQAPLWQAGGAARQTPVHRNRGLMETAQFSPDGNFLATASYDATARLWSVAEDRGIGQIGWHQHPIQCISISPDAALLATSQIGLVRVWRRAGDSLVRAVPVGAGSLAALSGDGQYFAASGVTHRKAAMRTTRVFETATGQPAGPELAADGLIMDAAFSPDKTVLAIACATSPDRAAAERKENTSGGNLQMWNWKTGTRLGDPIVLPSEPRGLAMHPSGDSIALYCGRGEGIEWNLASGSMRLLFSGSGTSRPQHTLNNGRCTWSADGRYLITWGQLNAFHIWDRQACREIATPPPLNQHIVHDLSLYGNIAALSPIGPPAPDVSFLDSANGKAIAAPLAHSDWLYLGRFDTTGDLLLTAGRRPVAQVWHWRQGALAGPALPHESEVMAGLFLPGRPWVVTGAHDGLVRFWDYRTGMPVRPPVQCPGLVLQLALTPDARHLLAAGFLGYGEIDIIDLERALAPAPRLLDTNGERLLAEINASATVHEGGGLVPLTGEAWLKKWQQFRRENPGHQGHRLSE